MAFTTPEGLVIGVLYGPTSDWVNNLLVAGHAQVNRRGKVRECRQPRLVGANEGLRLAPAIVRGPYRALGVRNFVQLTITPPDNPAA